MSIDNRLAQLALVACDASYNRNVKGPQPGVPADSLAQYDDTVEEPADWWHMPTQWNAAGQLTAWKAVNDSINVDTTGFGAVIYKNDLTNEVLVALRGSDGSNAQDWFSNLGVGRNQWESGAQALLDGLDAVVDANTKVHFTGQSLGGALAQYAAYDYAGKQKNRNLNYKPEDHITLTTFNALGAIKGLSGYNASLLANVQTAHYVTTNDLVSRLGGGNVNAAGNSYELKFRDSDGYLGLPDYPDLQRAHRIESGFYRGFRAYGGDFSTHAEPITNLVDRPLPVDTLQGYAAGFSQLFNDGKQGAIESFLRIIAGVTFAIGQAPEAEVKILIQAINETIMLNGDKGKVVEFLADEDFADALQNVGRNSVFVTSGMVGALIAANVLQRVFESDVPDHELAKQQQVLDQLATLTPPGTISPLVSTFFSYGLTPEEVRQRLHFCIKLLAVAEVPGSPEIIANEAVKVRLFEIALTEAIDWMKEAFNYVADQAEAVVANVGEAISSLGDLLQDAAREVEQAGSEFLDGVRQKIGDAVEGIAKGFGDAYDDFTKKFGNGVAWPSLVQFRQIRELHDALNKWGGGGGAGGAAGAEGTWDDPLASELLRAKRALEQAGQNVIIRTGPAGDNPFDAPNFDPTSAPLAVGSFARGHVETMTLYLPYEAGVAGQRIRINLTGGAAAQLSVLSQADVVPTAGGAYYLTVPAGQRSVTFGLWATADIGAAGATTLSAQLVDANNVSTHKLHDEATISLNVVADPLWGVPVAVDPTRTSYVVEGRRGLPVDRNQSLSNEHDWYRSGAGNDQIVGGAGNDWIFGTDKNYDLNDKDHLLGNAGMDSLFGMDGDDFLEGGADNDVLSGDIGDDRLFGDSLDTAVSVVTPGGAHELQRDWLAGGAGNDALYASNGDDVLTGGNDNDTMVGGAGNDYIFGDFDRVAFWGDVSTGEFLQQVDWTANGSALVDRGAQASDRFLWQHAFAHYRIGQGVYGMYTDEARSMFADLDPTPSPQLPFLPGDDVIYAGDGDDYVSADGGDDYVSGGAGRDEILGGTGLDRILGGSGDDTIYGDKILLSDLEVVPLAPLGEDYLDGEDGNDTIVGGGSADTILGGAGNDTLFGDSSDTPVAEQGADFIDGGSGDDVIGGGYGDDRLFGGEGADQIGGEGGNDVIHGEGGDDWLSGHDGDDTILGGEGIDEVTGDAGADTIFGGDGNDRLGGGGGNDLAYGGLGDDLLVGNEGDDVLEGEEGNDTLRGEQGNDTLRGGSGYDYLFGGDGDDTLDAGAGGGELQGESGNDTYLIGVGAASTTIDDSQGVNTIKIVSDITLESVRITQQGNAPSALALDVGGGYSLFIKNGLVADNQSFRFSNGSFVSRARLLDFAPSLDITGTAGTDSIQGGGQNDTLDAGDGGDTIAGGRGDDVIRGGGGSDEYVFARGDGTDIIIESDPDLASVDTLSFIAGISPNDVSLTRVAYDLRVSLNDTTESILLSGWFLGSDRSRKIEQIKFSDGTIWDETAIDQKILGWTIGSNSNDTLLGTTANDTIDGLAGNDTISGLAGNDTLFGSDGDDYLDGGADSDTIRGGDGADTLIGSDGSDTLDGGGGNDVLRGDGTVGAGADTLRGGDGNDSLDGGIGDDQLYGDAGDDTLSGGADNGVDDLYGGTGSDTYLFGRDSGTEVIHENEFESNPNTDVVQFAADIAPADISVERNSTFLVLRIKGTTNALYVENFLANEDVQHKVEQFKFADGTLWNVQTVLAMLIPVSEGNDNVQGFAWNDTIDALAGDDFIQGLGGNDQLKGGLGNDTLYGNEGDDTLDGGAGNDLLNAGVGDDTFMFGRGYGDDRIFYATSVDGSGTDTLRLGVDILPSAVSLYRHGTELRVVIDASATQLMVPGFFDSNADYKIENIVFGNGTVWNVTDINTRAIVGTTNVMNGTSGNDTFVVDDVNDTITEAANAGTDTVQSSVSFSLGTNLENLTLTGVLNIDATGNALANVVRGNTSNNVLDGQAGMDTLIGGDGDDTYIDNDLDFDTVTELANGGFDSLVVNDSYTLPANIEKLVVVSNAQRIMTLTGNALDNVLIGRQGVATDRFDGGIGADIMVSNGGGGTFYVDNVGDQIVSSGGSIDNVLSSISWTLAPNLDNLQLLAATAAMAATGNALDNELKGNTNANTLTGLSGRDTFYGGAGADTLVGGVGDDTYVLAGDYMGVGSIAYGTQLGSNQDSIIELTGEGNDRVFSLYEDYVLGENLEDLWLLQFNAASGLGVQEYVVHGTGNALNNSIRGNVGNNILDGRDGDDVLYGEGGNDTYVQSTGNDLIRDYSGGGGQSRVQIRNALSESDTTLVRSADNLEVRFTGSTDTITVEAQFSNVASPIIDTIEFANGTEWDVNAINTRIAANNASTITASADVIVGSNNADTLDGLAGNDSISGGFGDDTVLGSGGNDRLFGNQGNDSLDGGSGSDELRGNLGSDTYEFARGTGQDIIVEVDEVGAVDTIDIAAGIATSEITVSKSGTDLKLSLNGTSDEIRVSNFFFRSTPTTPLARLIEQVKFADGTIWNQATLVTMASTIRGTNAADDLVGGDEDEQIFGLAGDDWLYGNGGNDVLDGGTGLDNMQGGPGDDTYFVDTGENPGEAPNEGIDTVKSSVTYDLSSPGNDVENLELLGTNAINGTGNAANNRLAGNSANNTLNGAAGADTMLGGGGNDIYVVDNSGDVVSENANEGIDLVQTNVTYTLSANVENLTITATTAVNGIGNALDNALTGGSGANTLTGGAGNDTLNGGAGADSLIGGTGNDTYVVDLATDTITENLNEGIDTVQSAVTFNLSLAANVNIENLTLTASTAIDGTGNALDNVLIGGAGVNILDGGAGNDTLDGAAGNDQLKGGAGNDTYTVDAGDVITEAAGAGTDTLLSALTYSLNTTANTNVENLTLTGSGNNNATGNALANTLTGNAGNNTLDGGTGIDTLIGGLGNDIYVVDTTTDVITELANEGTDTIKSSITFNLAGNAMWANIENLDLAATTTTVNGTGNNLDNVLTGGSGANTLDGGAGNDTLNGGAGIDTLKGGTGNDLYVVDTATDVITELANEGTDTIKSSITFNLAGNAMWANIENLDLSATTTALNGTGNTLDNVLTGGSGANTLDGGAGNDTLDGGAGTDTLKGGAGHDTYVVDSTTDTITELANAGSDTVKSSVTYTLSAANVENVTLAGSSAINATGTTGNNLLTGNAGVNTLTGAAGIDILQGGDGNDVLTDAADKGLYNGGLGADSITGNIANELFIGGAGNDTITTGTGADLIVFNRGDGQDVVNASTGADNAISLGAGIDYASLFFRKNVNDLILDVGNSEQITLKDWYATTANNKSVVTLQMVAEAMAGFNPAGADQMRNNKIENFNFTSLANAFDQARTANPSLTSWALTNGLLNFMLAGSDTAALGGDLAYQYGKNGNLSNVSLTPAQAILSNTGFGTTAQALQPVASLQDTSPRLM